MVPADLMGHKSEGSVQRASPPGEELRCRPPTLPAGAVPRPRTAWAARRASRGLHRHRTGCEDV